MPFPNVPLRTPAVRPSHDLGWRNAGDDVVMVNRWSVPVTARIFIRDTISSPRRLHGLYVVPPGESIIEFDRPGDYSYTFVSKGVSLPAFT